MGEYSFKGTVNNDTIPPLVTPEIFEKCQKRLGENKHKAASFKTVEDKYLLTGKIFCGSCGGTMSGISGTGIDAIYRYYQCMASKKRRCGMKAVNKNIIEDKVISVTMNMFKDKKLIKRICDACYSMQGTESPELPALRKRLRENQKEIDNVMKAIKAGVVTKSTKAALEKLEREQENLETAISNEKICRPIISREQIEAWIMKFAATDLSSTEQKQRLIDVFVNSVFVYEDKLVVFLNYRDGEKHIPFDDLREKIKKPNTLKSGSTSLTAGDPYGN